MPNDPRVEGLIEQMLDSGSSAEDVCRDTPELLDRVREGWRRVRALEARIDELFPESGSGGDDRSVLLEYDLPRIPGYELIREVGRGGVGVVYKAVHLRLNRTVALKMPLAGAFATRAERLRFAREAEMVARLRHPNVVQVYDVGDLDGRPYFTMEFVEGRNLAQLIAGTPRPAREAATLVATLADAIAAAHQNGVVHRDLKPSNVLISADGTPKVTDFGLARRLEAGSSLTHTGAAVGTPSYMAPEQAQGRTSEVGPAADVYALGAVLYELLTGRPPFRSESAAETVQQVITQDPVAPSRLNGKVPRDLETICLKCLHKERLLRYATAAALRDDLRCFLRGEAIAARPEGRLRRLARRVRRRPARSATVAAGTLLAFTLIGGSLWLILDRAHTAHTVAVEQAALEAAAGNDLREMEHLQENLAWPEAGAALERAKGRLGAHGGSAALRRRLEQGTRELRLVSRVDEIRLRRATTHEDEAIAAARLDHDYEAALAGAGFGQLDRAAKLFVARLDETKIRSAIVDTFDHWASGTHSAARREWLLSVARLADPDPTGWRHRARGPKNYQDRSAVEALIARAPVAERCVPLFLALAKRAKAAGVDPVPFLKKVQQAHPGDIYANLDLAGNLLEKDPGEAVRYYQAALAIRPDAAVIRNNLGVAFVRIRRHEEAVGQYRMAVQLDPRDPVFRKNLAVTLPAVGRHDEAIEMFPSVLRNFSRDAAVRCMYGAALNASGKYPEAIIEFQQATSLDPRLRQARLGLRDGLLRVGRRDEASVVWRAAVADDPPEHNCWHGYAEFCLFQGREDEYGRIRQALLRRFGTSTDPHVAACVARACLLRPASDEELRQVVALGGRAWNVDPRKHLADYLRFQFIRGLAEYRQGDLDRAIATMRRYGRGASGPEPRLLLAMALHRSGQVEEARRTLAAVVSENSWRDDGARDQDGWIHHVLRREAESLIVPDLPAFLEGRYQPRDNDERLAMLGACWFEERAAAAARLYAEAFCADPRLAENLAAAHRYNAACAAALAGSGRGEDGAHLAREEWTRWREQARSWLELDLAAWARRLDGNRDADRRLVGANMAHWLVDSDLAGVREQESLSTLPSEERDAWLGFWKAVHDLLGRATTAP